MKARGTRCERTPPFCVLRTYQRGRLFTSARGLSLRWVRSPGNSLQGGMRREPARSGPPRLERAHSQPTRRRRGRGPLYDPPNTPAHGNCRQKHKARRPVQLRRRWATTHAVFFSFSAKNITKVKIKKGNLVNSNNLYLSQTTLSPAASKTYKETPFPLKFPSSFFFSFLSSTTSFASLTLVTRLTNPRPQPPSTFNLNFNPPTSNQK